MAQYCEPDALVTISALLINKGEFYTAFRLLIKISGDVDLYTLVSSIKICYAAI
jgi:hypothetical protein